MLHESICPCLAGGMRPHPTFVDVNFRRARPHSTYSEAGQYYVLEITSAFAPTMLIDASGTARFIKPTNRRGSFPSRPHIYLNKKKYKISTPFDQPLSVVILFYEKCVRDLKGLGSDWLGISANGTVQSLSRT